MPFELNYETLQTDVLVIGGGMAGWLAADMARAQGSRVLLADKGYVGKAGQSPVASDVIVFHPDFGDDVDQWIRVSSRAGEYLQNRDWTRKTLLESYDRYQDLLRWGIEFEKDENGDLVRPICDDGIIHQGVVMMEMARTDADFRDTFGYKARRHLESVGVEILDRVMIAEYLQDANGRVVGAVGLKVGENRLLVIQAGAVISCAGGSSYKPAGSGCLISITGDNEALAYRAGAELGGKEFVQPGYFDLPCPGKFGRRGVKKEQIPLFQEQPFGSGTMQKKNWHYYDGTEFQPHRDKISEYIFSYLDLDLDTHAGLGPIYAWFGDDRRKMISGSSLGMSLRHTGGIYPADLQCRSSLPGLFAAGDSLGTMTDGTIYKLRGGCLAGAAVTGATAGETAAREALSLEKKPLDPAEVARGCRVAGAPAACSGGYSPRWVSQMLTGLVTPYYVSTIKKQDRLEAALTMLAFMQEHLVPNLVARDPHELRLAHEAKNMVLCAEISLRSALFRTESRGMHYREDYPFRDDANWLCWTKLHKDGDTMAFEKVPIPEEWKPDPALTYREKYPYRFPGEPEEGL